MSYQGFGKASGPSAPPKLQHSFGNSDLPDSVSPLRDSSQHEAFGSRVQPHPMAFQTTGTASNLRHQYHRPVSPSLTFEDQPKAQGILPNSQAYQVRFPSGGSYDHDTNILTEFGNVQAPKRTKSPEKPFMSLRSAQTNLQRPSTSPPRSFSMSNTHEVVGSVRNIDAESVGSGFPSVPVPKRTRSPTLPSSDQVSGGNSHPTHDDAERERLAKAKRLARFKDELDEGTHNKLGSVDVRETTNRNEQSTTERDKYMSSQSLESSRNLAQGNSMPDSEALESSSIIIGLCPDMCPESERGERERKGDLDHYERLDGDRNQTSKLLAVKKYTRTAEREANLIRPMPVLLKTIDYLLDLLSQPYGEKFLGIYNFLWDRMRAIRMDLRMQHLFNEKAITMLEQMIRLHIIAMHELCEFSKGEGFAEGFDAHLNIEQMNKTSVELFQMYDDHRKRGIIVPSEKEFRGYYALLKLDKHPGYKVEPAELSLDLAKMTPEMRQTAEVKFARDVARACRTSNFIAFFRLVGKASYLQACLMHAHFAKVTLQVLAILTQPKCSFQLRTQALSSLHSGVQNNQGLPIAHVRKWIGMEEEDIEGLLEYHGFSVKVFEEPYMVRDGPFLNSDKDFATKCSKLVHMKRSRTIVNDVLPKSKNEYLINCATKKIPLTTKSKNEYLILDATKQIPLTRTKKESKTFSSEKISSPRPISTEKENSMHETDEEMTEFVDQLIPVDHKQVQPMIETSEVRQLHEYKHKANGALLQTGPRSCEPLMTEVNFVTSQGYDGFFMTSPVRNNSARMGLSVPLVSDMSLQKISDCGYNDSAIRSVEPQSIVNNVMEDEEIWNATQETKHDIVTESCLVKEIADARLKLILRLWRRRALKKKQLREQRLLAAKAAFDTLSVGPPIQLNNHKIRSIGIFDIDHIVSERWKRQKLSLSVVNVSEIVAGILSRRNVEGKCICWKLVVCSQRTEDSHFAAGSWLLSKLLPSKANDLVFSSSFLSIWKSWLSGETGVDLSCILSIVRHTNFDNLSETVHGASAILFVASESIPLDLQRTQLHKLLASIPSGSYLPLLILSDFHDEVSASLANELNLYNIDKSRIHSFQVVSLLDNPHLKHLEFFSDEKLKEGLKWLANESPSQPLLHRVKVLDLIISHLDSSMEVLDSMNEKEVSPNHCISAFNLALDQSVVDITAAVKANPSNWPCPEIALLESCNELAFTTDALPPVGWSLVENVEPLKQALMDLKLPTFPDMSWLTKGSTTINEIPTVRDNLESCLRCYLTQTSDIMGQQLALEEAHIMLQKCAKLELHNFNYSIVSHWVTIFRRIFNWRLRYFPSRASIVHIVDCCHGASVSSSIRLESREPPSYRPNQPLLDEVIEVACSSISIDQKSDFSEALQPPSTITSNSRHREVIVATTNFANDESNSTQQIGFVSSESVTNSGQELNCTGKELVVSDTGYSEAARLMELLDLCNKRQDAIEKVLSIYF